MTMHLQRDLDRLQKNILLLGSLVETAANLAIEALTLRRAELAGEVYAAERRINAMEVDIEEDCLKILALHQPVAGDLRFIIVVLKVNNDLERMGDLAVNIVERVEVLVECDELPVEHNFQKMGEIVRNMVRMSLDALVKLDPDLARRVLDMDDEVDTLNREMYSILQAVMQDRSSLVEVAVSTLSASRHLERIADLATNIAEDVIFMEEGEVVRHQRRQVSADGPGDAEG